MMVIQNGLILSIQLWHHHTVDNQCYPFLVTFLDWTGEKEGNTETSMENKNNKHSILFISKPTLNPSEL